MRTHHLMLKAILTCEREKTWAEVGGMIDDMSVFDVLSYPDHFSQSEGCD